MKKQNYRNLSLFDRTITIPVDGGNFEEKYDVHEQVLLSVYENTWLTPGTTFNDTYRNNNGVYEVPVYGKFGADITDLTAESGATGYQGTTYEKVTIDKKISTVIDSTFISKGLADKSEVALIKQQIGPSLAEQWQNHIEGFIRSNATPYEYTAADMASNPRKILVDAKTRYKRENQTMPTTLLISYEFEGTLTNTFASGSEFTPSNNDRILVNGTIGRFLGMMVIPTSITEAFYMYNWRMLHIPIAKNAFSDKVSDDYYAIASTSGIYNRTVGSLQVIEDTNAKSGTKETWFHMHFGKKIISPRQFYIGVEAGTNLTPPVITVTTPTITSWTTADNGTKTFGDLVTEAGITSVDDVDGDITADLVFNSNKTATDLIDLSAVGNTSVTVESTDSSGNTATEIVTITIAALSPQQKPLTPFDDKLLEDNE